MMLEVHCCSADDIAAGVVLDMDESSLEEPDADAVMDHGANHFINVLGLLILKSFSKCKVSELPLQESFMGLGEMGGF